MNWRGPTPQQGWWAGVIGSPLGYPGILTTGVVSSINTSTFKGTTTAPINHGNSGGPVFDRIGRVIGLATAKYVDSEGFGIFHGTPLLCGKIIVCTGAPDVWTGSITASSTPTPTATVNSSPLALAAINDFNTLIDKANKYLLLEDECIAIGQDLDQVAADIVSSTAMHYACGNEDANIRDYSAKAKELFENSPANNDQDYKNISARFSIFSEQIEISGKKIMATVRLLTESLSNFAELGQLIDVTKGKYESELEKWSAFEDRLDWMPSSTKKTVKSSSAYKAGIKSRDTLQTGLDKIDSIIMNFSQIDSASRVTTALTSLKLVTKVDLTLALVKNRVLVEKLIPKYVCYSDNKVVVLPKTGKCPSGTTKTLTNQ